MQVVFFKKLFKGESLSYISMRLSPSSAVNSGWAGSHLLSVSFGVERHQKTKERKQMADYEINLSSDQVKGLLTTDEGEIEGVDRSGSSESDSGCADDETPVGLGV